MASTLRIMIVEDEFIIADEIAAIVLESGNEVIGPVATIEEALASLTASDRPDLAILDANLRGRSSVSVAERLRELGVPLCLCTGYRLDDLRATFGDVAILQKPVDPRALVAVIDGLKPGQEQSAGPPQDGGSRTDAHHV